jgi:predicted Zn-dependent protease
LLALGVLVTGAFLARGPVDRWLARLDLHRAHSALAAQRVDEAAAALAAALHRNPRLGQARAALGELELGRGRLEEAFLQFQALSELEPENPAGWDGLARVRMAAGQPDAALAALDSLLGVAPDRVARRLDRAELRLERQRFRGAGLDAEAVLKSDPRSARAWAVLARSTAVMKGRAAGVEVAERALRQVGPDPRLPEVLAAARTAPEQPARPPLQLDPDLAERTEFWPGALGTAIREFLGRLERKDWPGAEQLVAAARRNHPTTFLGPWMEALLAVSRQQYDAAERLLNEALRASPRAHRPISNLITLWTSRSGVLTTGERLEAMGRADPGFQYPLPIAAHAYLEADQPARAEATARLGLAAVPPSPVPARDLVDLYLDLDRSSDALAACEQGLGRFPGDPGLLLRQARAYALLGDRARALEAYQRFVDRWPDASRAVAELAVLLEETRDDATSHARALELVRGLEFDGPLDPAVAGSMGRVYARSGADPERAQQLLELAVRGAPDDPALHYLLAVARKANGNREQAAAELHTALGLGRPFPEEAEARRMLRELSEGSPSSGTSGQ